MNKPDLAETKPSKSIDIAVTFGLFLYIAAISCAVRVFFYENTTGLLYGSGVEENFRLSMVDILPESGRSYLIHTMAPLQTILGRFLSEIFPHHIYITRPISLAAGILTPGIIFLTLKKANIYAGAAAAFILAFSVPHILFSTVGTAEAISFLFLATTLFAAMKAEDSAGRQSLFKAGIWSLAGIFSLSLACLTRFEAWVGVPLLIAWFTIRERKLALIWLLSLAAPSWWLYYSNKYFGGALKSTSLNVNEYDFTAGIANASEAIRFITEFSGQLILFLALAGLIYLSIKKSGRIFAVFVFALSGFFFFMIISNKVPAEFKYASNLCLWYHALSGVAVGALLFRILVLSSGKKNIGVGLRPLKFRDVLILFVALPLLAFSLQSPALSLNVANRLVEETRCNKHLDRFLSDLERIHADRYGGRPLIYFQFSYTNGYTSVYSGKHLRANSAMLKKTPGGVISNDLDSFLGSSWRPARKPGDDLTLTLLVTERFNPLSSADDLSEQIIIQNHRLNRIYQRHRYRIYEMFDLTNSAPSLQD